MKTRAWLTSILTTVALSVSLVLPATAQNFPNIGDVISIIGSSRNGNRNQNRNGGYVGNNNRGVNISNVIGIASVLYGMSRQGQQNSYPGNDYPRNGNNGYPDNNGYPSNNNYPGNGYPSNGGYSYPGNSSSNGVGRPDGYAYIENAGQPVHVDPRVLPLTVNAGGGRGDEVVGRAIANWNNAGIGQVFALTNGPADLVIDWSGSKVSSGARAETRMIRSSRYVMPTDLSVRTGSRSPEQLARVLTHELGHVLGLDHSQSRSDVMYASEQDGPASLTQRDVAMAHWLYSLSSYSPVIGRTDMSGGNAPSVATNWTSNHLSDADATNVEGNAVPVCSLHDH